MAKRKHTSELKLSTLDDLNLLYYGLSNVELTLILAKKQFIKTAQKKNCIFLRMLWYGSDGVATAVPITIFGIISL